ncbi:irregular chiasm C-roughest protein isoform X2 [Hermetia illucens]|uniref:irregular chiasm C-roughest protein isoform X2 n=1 Tax=Hermetia illucens TaxID=343691 RepID=UPI0018CC4802|nr:irregular chiasm C-roughest protein isoform X2 [Hermetia illucens]
MSSALRTLVTIVVCFAFSEINGLQRFAEQPVYTEVNPNEDAILSCKVIDKQGSCSWQKDNKPVGIYPKKYEWAASSMMIHQSLQPPHYGGDCSLWIRSATLDFDDGFWECQVTASDFTTQDALTSQPVRLVVRVTPQRPRLEHEGVHVPPGHNVTVDSGGVATVKCISHYGNPPATLKWFLGGREIPALGAQVNATEADNPRTWSATSVVQVKASRERHGEMLQCIAFHESYATKSMSVEARMDIKYAPTIRLLGAPQIDLEEGKDVLILRCEADANPPASIVWRRSGRSEIASLQESLQLRPVSRGDAGLYTCQAQNTVGTSEQLSVEVDVKYPPRINIAGPDLLTTAPLYSPAAFICDADGNPPPTFKWFQRLPTGSKLLERGMEKRLVIDNVTYDYQGEYECHATNYINGQERTVTSSPVSLQVVGAPQVLRLHPGAHSVSVRKGQTASLSLVVCADPRPRHVAWEWGSLRLEAGAGITRYHADEVLQDSREDCYLSTLHIRDVDMHDARPYYLVVENERGVDRHAVHLIVEEPLEMSYLLGIAGGCIAALLILICLCIYAVRAKKCCFKGRSGYKSSDKDSEKADLKSRSDSTSGPQGDSIYTTPAGFHHNHHHGGVIQGSPEAMKSTTHLLQPWKQSQHSSPHQEQQSHKKKSPGLKTGHTLTYTIPSSGDQTYSASAGLLGSQRHQRDLFSGDLGIPEITTRVGSVIHAFETMAMLRKNDANLAPMLRKDDSCKSLTTGERNKSYRASKISLGSKYNQMKRKSTESRNKVALASTSSHSLPDTFFTLRPQNYPLPIDVPDSKSQCNPSFSVDIRQNVKVDPKHDTPHHSVQDDYRKNLFGSQSLKKRRSKIPLLGGSSYKSTAENDDDFINKAFNGIFDNVDDEDDNDDDKNNNRSAIPSKLNLRPSRSSTLNDIFEFTKNKNQSLRKSPSSSSTTAIFHADAVKDAAAIRHVADHPSRRGDKSKYDFNYPTSQQKHQQISDNNDNFIRGSTLSQSFIKNGGGDSSVPPSGTREGALGACNYRYLESNTRSSPSQPLSDREGNTIMSSSHQTSGFTSGSGMSRKTRHPLAMMAVNQQKRSKSSTEIVDELTRRKNFKRATSNILFKPRTMDRAEI